MLVLDGHGTMLLVVPIHIRYIPLKACHGTGQRVILRFDEAARATRNHAVLMSRDDTETETEVTKAGTHSVREAVCTLLHQLGADKPCAILRSCKRNFTHAYSPSNGPTRHSRLCAAYDCCENPRPKLPYAFLE